MLFVYGVLVFAINYAAGSKVGLLNETLPLSCRDHLQPDPCLRPMDPVYPCGTWMDIIKCWYDMLYDKCKLPSSAVNNIIKQSLAASVDIPGYINDSLVKDSDQCRAIENYLNPTPPAKLPELPCSDHPEVKKGDCKPTANLKGANWTASCDCNFVYQRNHDASLRCVLNKNGSYVWLEEGQMCELNATIIIVFVAFVFICAILVCIKICSDHML